MSSKMSHISNTNILLVRLADNVELLTKEDSAKHGRIILVHVSKKSV